MAVSSSSAAPSVRRAWPKNAADELAVEPDPVVAVAHVRQLASFAQMVDVRGRAAEQRRNLNDVERKCRGFGGGAWHILGT